MIYAEKGKEQECFIDFVEKALGTLAQEKYHDFLVVFDNSRILTEEDLISALQYLDKTRPVLKIDDPKKVKNQNQEIGSSHNHSPEKSSRLHHFATQKSSQKS